MRVLSRWKLYSYHPSPHPHRSHYISHWSRLIWRGLCLSVSHGWPSCKQQLFPGCWSSQSSNLVEGHYSKSRFKVQLRFSRSSTSRIVYAHSSERHLGEAMWPCNANHKITSRHDAIGEFQTPFCKQDLICLEFQMAWHNFSNHGQSRWGSMPTT